MRVDVEFQAQIERRLKLLREIAIRESVRFGGLRRDVESLVHFAGQMIQDHSRLRDGPEVDPALRCTRCRGRRCRVLRLFDEMLELEFGVEPEIHGLS